MFSSDKLLHLWYCDNYQGLLLSFERSYQEIRTSFFHFLTIPFLRAWCVGYFERRISFYHFALILWIGCSCHCCCCSCHRGGCWWSIRCCRCTSRGSSWSTLSKKEQWIKISQVVNWLNSRSSLMSVCAVELHRDFLLNQYKAQNLCILEGSEILRKRYS